MYITSRYLGTEIRGLRYLFFLLTEDYVRAQKRIKGELDCLLHVFARDLGEDAAFVQPFEGDERATKSHVMEKNWTPDEKKILKVTPGFLIISVDFTEFRPDKDKWVYVSLRQFMSDTGEIYIYKLRDAFEVIVEACRAGEDIFTAVHNYYAEQAKKQMAASIQLKPGMFGFGIDLKGMVAALHPRAT